MQIDKDYIEKNDMIRRYHQNKLSDVELNSFEIYILENPDIINLLEKEKLIHDAFKEHEPLLKDVNEEKSIPAWGKGFAAAACLLVAVLAVLNYTGSQFQYDLQSPVRLETFRGAGNNTIQVSGQPIVQFQIDMGPVELIENNVFTAELVDAGGEALFTVPNLSADSDGWLYYALEGQNEVLTGDFEVRVFTGANPVRVASFLVQFSSP